MKTIAQAAQTDPQSYLDKVREQQGQIRQTGLDWTKPEEQIATQGTDRAAQGTGIRITGSDPDKSWGENIIQAVSGGLREDSKGGGSGGQQEWVSTGQALTDVDSGQVQEGISSYMSGGAAGLAASVSKEVISGIGGLMRYQQQLDAKGDKETAQNTMKMLEKIYDEDMARQRGINTAQGQRAQAAGSSSEQAQGTWLDQI